MCIQLRYGVQITLDPLRSHAGRPHQCGAGDSNSKGWWFGCVGAARFRTSDRCPQLMVDDLRLPLRLGHLSSDSVGAPVARHEWRRATAPRARVLAAYFSVLL